MTISLLDRVDYTVGKGENAAYQHFLLFPQCFPKLSFLGSLKVRIVWQRVNKQLDSPCQRGFKKCGHHPEENNSLLLTKVSEK